MDDITEAIAAPTGEPEPLWAHPLRGALALFRQRPGLWLLLSIPAAAFATNPYSAFTSRSNSTSGPIAFPISCVLSCVVLMVLSAYVVAWPTRVMAMARQALGVPVAGVSDAWDSVAQRFSAFLRLGCAYATVAILVIAPISLVVLPAASRGFASSSPTVTAERIVIVNVIWVVVYARLGFVLESVLLAGDRVMAGFGRSWELTRGRFWPMAGYRTFQFLPTYVIAFGRLLPWPARITAHPLWIPTGVGTRFALYLIWTPFTTALFILLWYRLRAENEGLDAAAAAAELVPPPHSSEVGLPELNDDTMPPDIN